MDQLTREVELRDLELGIKQPNPRRRGAAGRRTFRRNSSSSAARRRISDMAESLAQEVLELDRRLMALDARLKARADTGHGGALAATDFLLSQRNLGHISGIREPWRSSHGSTVPSRPHSRSRTEDASRPS